MRRDLHDMMFVEHHRTPQAVLVSEDGDEDTAVWLPLSQIEIGEPGEDGAVEVTAPEWLLMDKGLL